ncbi:MAG: transcriptional regulator PaaX [Firmicutes bacterium]|nr:transcriptional regulator PaaX [Bacillota bacterium]HBQ95668.1 transcriptional regulator PaaX [Sulfobacillus sp.]
MHSQSLFFTIFGDYIIDHGGRVRAASLVKMMSEFGLTESAVRAGLFRLAQNGLVEVHRVGNQSHYTLSHLGMSHLREGTQRVYHPLRHQWDRLWRLFIYNISETRRERRDVLRRELQWHGLAPLAQSTWISPNPIESVLQNLIEEYLSDDTADIVVGSHMGDPFGLVKRCWNLIEIQRRYEEFMQEWKPMLGDVNISDNTAFVRRINLVHAYRKFLNIDPNLPDELLPENWLGHEAQTLFQQLHQQWTPQAGRFFQRVFKP